MFDMAYEYDVFLSYRHKPLDAEITQKAFNILESYRLPVELKKQGFSGIRRVFRDTEELAVSRVLSDTIEAALRSCNCLVVVCSPDTPSSEWVNREVETFIELGRSDKVYPLLIAGAPDTSFPPALSKIPDIDDRILDVRAPGDDPKKIIKNARIALLCVIARVSGCPERELERRDKMRNARKSLMLRLGPLLIFAVAALICWQLWMAAVEFREDARREQNASMAILSALTYEIPNSLVELPRTYGIAAAILEDNSRQIKDILELSVDKTTVLPEIAANDERQATTLIKMGFYDRAIEKQLEAIVIYKELEQNGEAIGSARLASAMNNLGVALETTGAFEGAARAYEYAIDAWEMFEAENPADFPERLEYATYIGNLAQCKLRQGDTDSAEAYLASSNSILSELVVGGYDPAVRSLGINLNNLGVMYYGQGVYDRAELVLAESIRLAEEAFEKKPNRTMLSELTRSQISLATCFTLQAKFDEALLLYEQATAAQEFLAADAENVDAQNSLALLYNNYGMCLNMTKDYSEASVYYLKNVDILENIFNRAGTPLSQAALARACYNTAENAFKDGDYVLSKQYFDRCLTMYEPVSVDLGNYHRSEYLARLAYYQIIIEPDFPAALENATTASELQPDSSFISCNLGYALMFNDLLDECDRVFTELASWSEGEVGNVQLDFEAMEHAGITHTHMSVVLEKMRQR